MCWWNERKYSQRHFPDGLLCSLKRYLVIMTTTNKRTAAVKPFQSWKILHCNNINCCAAFQCLIHLHIHGSVTQIGLCGSYFIDSPVPESNTPHTNAAPCVFLTGRAVSGLNIYFWRSRLGQQSFRLWHMIDGPSCTNSQHCYLLTNPNQNIPLTMTKWFYLLYNRGGRSQNTH